MKDNKYLYKDDIRLYLTQMGRIPLLNRTEELGLARKISHYKHQIILRLCMLENFPAEIESLGEILIDIHKNYQNKKKNKNETAGTLQSILHGDSNTKYRIEEYICTLKRLEERIQELTDLYYTTKSGIKQTELKQKINIKKRNKINLISEFNFKYKILKKIINELEDNPLNSRDKIHIDQIKKLRKKYETAIQDLAAANIRLVISIAKRFYKKEKYKKFTLDDFIAYGNIGLMKAVEKYDYAMEHKFSTYATYWIKQAIFRALKEETKNIRIPSHMLEARKKVGAAIKNLKSKLNREPSVEEISKETKLKCKIIKGVLKMVKQPISINTKIQDNDLIDFLEDTDSIDPAKWVNLLLLKQKVHNILETLSSREKEVLCYRFGIGRKRHTLEETGKKLKVTKERIRQIEARAVRRVKHPSRSKKLIDFLEDAGINNN